MNIIRYNGLQARACAEMTSKSTQNRHVMEIDNGDVKLFYTTAYIYTLDVCPMSCYSLAPPWQVPALQNRSAGRLRGRLAKAVKRPPPANQRRPRRTRPAALPQRRQHRRHVASGPGRSSTTPPHCGGCGITQTTSECGLSRTIPVHSACAACASSWKSSRTRTKT